MKYRKGALVAGVACVFAFGCGHAANSRVINGMPAPSDAVVVSVQNTNWQDVDVYAVAGGQRVRLGNVTTARTANFILPGGMSLAPDLRIQVHPLAANRDFLSSRIVANPGDVIEVMVMNALAQTSVVVR
jgi:hypothetical protein